MTPISSTIRATPASRSPTKATTAYLPPSNYGLAADVENLILQGNADLQAYGNNQANVIYGNCR